MDSRLKFLPRVGTVTTEGVTQEARRIRAMEIPDQGSRRAGEGNPFRRAETRRGAFVTKAKPLTLYCREKPLGRDRRARTRNRLR